MLINDFTYDAGNIHKRKLPLDKPTDTYLVSRIEHTRIGTPFTRSVKGQLQPGKLNGIGFTEGQRTDTRKVYL